jgi:uncharacterized protein YggE
VPGNGEGLALGQAQGLTLSVRGEASHRVPPDSVVFAGQIAVAKASKPDAVRAVARALDALTSGVAALGGVPLTAESGRSSLTWSAYAATTYAEREHNPVTGRHELTGQTLASVELQVSARDFGLLEALQAVFSGQEAFNVNNVNWYVDDDNPAWPEVRTAAINAAVSKARDYAAALGTSLTSVEHVADVGLLAGSGEAARVFPLKFGRSASAGRAGSGAESPSLDPVPQELTAVVEARFRAATAPLPVT